jgi:hypothetical protein
MMHDSKERRRTSAGFSLDEASRLYRSSSAGHRLLCPTCGGRMRDVVGAHPHSAVWLIRCEACGRGLVFDGPSSETED